MRLVHAFAVLLLAAGAAWGQERAVGGLVIDLGLMPAWKAMEVEGHRDAHSHEFVSRTSSQHLLIVVSEQVSGRRLGDAQVMVEVTDPKGQVQKKALHRTQAAGQPDYSEVFEFGWSGRYTVRVNVVPKPGAKAVGTTFAIKHVL